MDGASPAPRAWRRVWVLLFIASAAPAAFAVEAAARALLFPADFEVLRAELEPTLTIVAWTLLAVCVASIPLGLACNRWLVRRGLAGPSEASPARRERVELEALLLSSSIPQLPALLATVATLGGARVTPVLATLVVSTLGVLLQATSLTPRR
jgi:hypothetical protein